MPMPIAQLTKSWESMGKMGIIFRSKSEKNWSKSKINILKPYSIYLVLAVLTN